MSTPYTSYHDWLKRRLNDDAPEMTEINAYDFLLEALNQNAPQSIFRIFEECPSWICSNVVPNTKDHPVVIALREGHRECLNVFLAASDCEKWQFSGEQSLLHFAVHLQADWAIEPLLATEMDYQKNDIAGLSAIEWAVLYGNDKVLTAFEQANILLTPPCEDCLYNAITTYLHQRLSTFKQDPNELDYLTQSCLKLKSFGVDPNFRPSLIHLAQSLVFKKDLYSSTIQQDIKESFDFCIMLGAQLEDTDGFRISSSDGSSKAPQTALELAIATLNEPLYDLLIQAGADPKQLTCSESLIAWRSILSRDRHSPPLNYLSEGSPRLEFLEHLCNQSGFWPPFASNATNTLHLIEKLAHRQTDPALLLVHLEAMELSISTAKDDIKPSKTKKML